MTKCDYCGSTIVFGGAREAGRCFCNDRCRKQGVLLSIAEQFPPEMVQQRVKEVHQGSCPNCRGHGPIDVHTSHRVWSAVYLTSWSSRPQVCCRSCGTKRELGDAAFSLVLGWWGVPWGLIMTPVQVVRNLSGVFGGPDPARPSAQLEKFVRMTLAAQAAAPPSDGRRTN
jgi:hypothetical protein